MSSNNVLPRCPCDNNCEVSYINADTGRPIHETAIAMSFSIAGFHQIMYEMEQTVPKFRLINPFVLDFKDYIFKSQFRCYACDKPMPMTSRVFCNNCNCNDNHIDPESGMDKKITKALSALIHSMWAVENEKIKNEKNENEKFENENQIKKLKRQNEINSQIIIMMELASDENEQLLQLKQSSLASSKFTRKPTRKSARLSKK